MTEWNFCPQCKKSLSLNEYGPTCPDGHFTKYPTPVAATIALIRNAGEYLAIKRSHPPKKDFWDLPGGFVEPGETAFETLMREIKEETQLEVSVVKYIGTFPSVYGETGTHTLATTYLFDAINRDVVLSEENTETMWFTLDNIPELAFDDCKRAVETLKSQAS